MRLIAGLILVNILATGLLFFFTFDRGEPLVAPWPEISMLLRWAVIAVVVAILEALALLGWKRGGRG